MNLKRVIASVMALSIVASGVLSTDASVFSKILQTNVISASAASSNVDWAYEVPDKYGENGKDSYHHLTALGRLNGDNDGDGLTVGDALAIQRKLLGLSEDEQSAKALIGKTYVYEKSGSFTITFDEHGRFACHEKDILSYMTEGTWELNGDTVKLAYPVDENTEKAVYLKLKDSDLVYIGEKSDNFTSVKVQLLIKSLLQARKLLIFPSRLTDIQKWIRTSRQNPSVIQRIGN